MKARHVHDWTPVPGRRACYSCACGAAGWRRAIIQEVELLPDSGQEEHVTARPIADYRTGRVKARIPDEWEEETNA